MKSSDAGGPGGARALQRGFKDRAAWRAWLSSNHAKEKELWLVLFKKKSGKPGVGYDEAVEEALCFGWIDGLLKSVDDERYMLRFTPRRAGSVWSESNLRRVERLKREGKMTRAGLDAARGGKKNPIHDILKKDMDIPAYITRALKSRREAWEFFCALPPSHKRQYVWWIHSAKKDETRERRLAKAVDLLAKGRKPGIDGFRE